MVWFYVISFLLLFPSICYQLLSDKTLDSNDSGAIQNVPTMSQRIPFRAPVHPPYRVQPGDVHNYSVNHLGKMGKVFSSFDQPELYENHEIAMREEDQTPEYKGAEDDLSIDLEEYTKQFLPQPTYPVVLHPKRRTQLYAEVDAPIEQIQFYMGQTFAKGDVLIRMKNNRFVGRYEKAVAFLDKAEAELKATSELYEEYIASFFELNESKANVAEAKSELILAEDDLLSTIVSAPYSGRVVSLFVEEYEMPPANKQLIEIIDDRVLVAKLLVKATVLNDLEIGQEITIDVGGQGKAVTATLTRIGAMIDSSSATIKVEAEINNEEGKLKAGMTGTAIINAPINTN